jgi:hypothetical protein
MSSDTTERTSRRPRQAVVARAAAAAAGILAIAACGSVAAPASGGSGSGSGSSSPAAPKGSLSISVQDGPGTAIKHWTLRCDPPGGTHPHAAAACAALIALKNPFAKPAAGQMCPMILASARRATFTGTWFGTKIDQTIVDGGCDLARWSKLGPVMH